MLPRAPYWQYWQWVFTVPKPLRLVLARDPTWTSWIGGLVVHAIVRHHQAYDRQMRSDGECDAREAAAETRRVEREKVEAGRRSTAGPDPATQVLARAARDALGQGFICEPSIGRQLTGSTIEFAVDAPACHKYAIVCVANATAKFQVRLRLEPGTYWPEFVLVDAPVQGAFMERYQFQGDDRNPRPVFEIQTDWYGPGQPVYCRAYSD